MFNALKGYRTLLLNLGAALLAIVDYLANAGGLLASVFASPERAALATIVLGSLNVALRMVTTSPVGKQ